LHHVQLTLPPSLTPSLPPYLPTFLPLSSSCSLARSLALQDTKEDIGTPPQFEHWTGAVSGLTNVPTFSGMKTDLTKQITPNFAVVHRMHMGGGPQQGMPDYYQFGAQVFDESLVAIAQIDKSGMVEGQFIVPALAKPWQEYGGKLITIFLPDKNDIYWVDFTVNKETFASQLRLASNHQMVPGYMMGLAYTQSITPRFSMGGETTLNINSLQTTSAACAKYNTKDWCATGKFSAAPDRQPGSEATTTEINAQYQRKVVPGRINLGTELSLAMGPGGLHNQVMFGAEFQLKQSKVATSVDGSGKICTTIDSKIDPHMSVTLSAEMAYSAGQPDQATGVPTDAFRCGFGFTMQ